MNHYQNQTLENMYNNNNFGTDISMLNNPQYHNNYIVPYSHNNIDGNKVDSNSNIPKLVSDINKSLEEYTIDSPHSVQEDIDILEMRNEMDEVNEFDENKADDEEEGWFQTIPYWLKEILLFLVIYFIFSMGAVKNTIGTYIKYINPDSNGNVSFVGVIIYGVLLACTFILARHFIL